MIKWILLGILATNSLWSISQNGYPKEVKLSKDTVVCFTYSQVKEINSELEKSKGKDELILSLEKLNSSYESSIIAGQSLVLNYKQQIEEYQLQVRLNDGIINSLEAENQKLRKKLKNTKIWGIIGGFLGGSLITGVTVGLLTK